jgi:tRNA (guanine-N7-)-methyltransferase
MEHLKSYVVRSGRMSNLQRRAYEELSSRYCINFSPEKLDCSSVFHGKAYNTYILEIGFGMGIATAEIAESYPDTGFICTEVFKAGIGKLLSEIDRRELENTIIIQKDAYDVVFSMLPDNLLDGVHIFFPDPWPKKKHHKRRLIRPDFLTLLSSKMKKGAYLYLVTDWREYAFSMLESIDAVSVVTNPDNGFAAPTEWRPQTRYERKAREKGRRIFEIRCLKQ